MTVKKYTGRLARTIARKRIGLLADESEYLAETKRVTDEMFSKFPDLFLAHGVEAGNWMALSLALAQSHVPGFKVVKPVGRKTTWDVSQKAAFRLDVDTIIEKSEPKKLSVVEAIKLACRLEMWADKTKPMKLSALEKHYYDANLVWVEMVRKARAYESIVTSN